MMVLPSQPADIIIDTAFESGNFVVHQINENQIIGSISRDSNNKDFQWFYFTVESKHTNHLPVIIKDVMSASYPSAWAGYRACMRDEQDIDWQTIHTKVVDTDLVFTVPMRGRKVHICYFLPYTLAQHRTLSQCFTDLACVKHFSADTFLGNKIELFQFGAGSSQNIKKIWIIARQHSGESVAGYFMEGLAEAFASDHKLLHILLKRYQFYIIHNANPDGVMLGKHRTNTTGSDLNRSWGNMGLQVCPEVRAIQKWMNRHPPQICLDVHGDERTLHPYMLVKKDFISDQYQSLFESLGRNNPGLEIRYQSHNEIESSTLRHYINQQFEAVGTTLELPCQYHENMGYDPIASVKRTAFLYLQSLLY